MLESGIAFSYLYVSTSIFEGRSFVYLYLYRIYADAPTGLDLKLLGGDACNHLRKLRILFKMNIF